ncbi:MAG: hypothetical protein AB7S54_03950 [Bacteroidales bacterium]
MIHIATVHWETDKWIDVQLNYLNNSINQPFRIYAFLSGDAARHRSKYSYSCTEPIKEHAIKLNLLAETIEALAESDSDPLIFIDGDAFPVGKLDTFIAETLQEYPLAAIQRPENVGDIQPHPSFCLTTVGFWKKIKGDWTEGFEWITQPGVPRTDVGGNLLKILNDNHICWKPLLRTGQLTGHPVMCGIYENLIYHHGAGFRSPLSRYDRLKPLETVVGSKIVGRMLDVILKRLSLKNRFRIHRILGISGMLEEKNKQLSDGVYDEILAGRISFKSKAS